MREFELQSYDGISFVHNGLTVDFYQLECKIQAYLYNVFIKNEISMPDQDMLDKLQKLQLRFYQLSEKTTTVSWSAEQMLDNIDVCHPSRYVSWTTGAPATYVNELPHLWSKNDHWNEIDSCDDHKSIRATIEQLCDPRQILIDLDTIDNLPLAFKACKRRQVGRNNEYSDSKKKDAYLINPSIQKFRFALTKKHQIAYTLKISCFVLNLFS